MAAQNYISSAFKLLLTLLICWANGVLYSQDLYYLNFGEAEPGLDTFYSSVTPHTANFWSDSPTGTFRRIGLEGIRKPAERTGVLAQRLSFTLHVEPGEWIIQFTCDAGFEEISTQKVEINDRIMTSGWQEFRPPPVPRESLMSHFRVWQNRIQVSQDEISITIEGGKDSVRLLEAKLFRLEPVHSIEHSWIMDQLSELGIFSARNRSLEPLADELNRRRASGDPWYHFWYTQVDLLRRAEWIFESAGWEWAKRQTGMSMIQRAQQGVMLLDPLLHIDYQPLDERARWRRAKFLFDLDLEYVHFREREAAQADLLILAERYPQSDLLRMYRGERLKSTIPGDGDVTPDATAPAWSRLQLKALGRLRALVHYWILERQASNGELGGKLGDDVEALRFMLPLLYLGDSITISGWKKLADAVWYSDEVEDGFARHIDDVEHAAEFISDTGPPLVLVTDDTAYHQRILLTRKHMLDLWTDTNSLGHRHFKSSWLSATALDERPPRNRDVPYNSRAVQPLRYWLKVYPEDSLAQRLLTEWAMAWWTASQRTEKNKPLGVVPASIRLHDMALNGDEPNWYDANMFWDYYNWSGEYFMLDHFLFMASCLRDESLVLPLNQILEIIENHNSQASANPGTEAWVANQYLKSRGFWSVIGQWRLGFQDKRFDSLLVARGPAYIKYKLTGDESYLATDLNELVSRTDYNWPMMTEEVYYTDRVLATHQQEGGSLPWEVLTAMLTGEVVRNGISPYAQITWQETFPGFTALLQEHSSQHLEIDVYHHLSTTQVASFKIWELEQGNYELSENGKVSREIAIHKKGQKVSIHCQPGLNKIQIKRK